MQVVFDYYDDIDDDMEELYDLVPEEETSDEAEVTEEEYVDPEEVEETID